MKDAIKAMLQHVEGREDRADVVPSEDHPWAIYWRNTTPFNSLGLLINERGDISATTLSHLNMRTFNARCEAIDIDHPLHSVVFQSPQRDLVHPLWGLFKLKKPASVASLKEAKTRVFRRRVNYPNPRPRPHARSRYFVQRRLPAVDDDFDGTDRDGVNIVRDVMRQIAIAFDTSQEYESRDEFVLFNQGMIELALYQADRQLRERDEDVLLPAAPGHPISLHGLSDPLNPDGRDTHFEDVNGVAYTIHDAFQGGHEDSPPQKKPRPSKPEPRPAELLIDDEDVAPVRRRVVKPTPLPDVQVLKHPAVQAPEHPAVRALEQMLDISQQKDIVCLYRLDDEPNVDFARINPLNLAIVSVTTRRREKVYGVEDAGLETVREFVSAVSEDRVGILYFDSAHIWGYSTSKAVPSGDMTFVFPVLRHDFGQVPEQSSLAVVVRAAINKDPLGESSLIFLKDDHLKEALGMVDLFCVGNDAGEYGPLANSSLNGRLSRLVDAVKRDCCDIFFGDEGAVVADEFLSLICRKIKAINLTGAPGTSKSFLAKRLAYTLAEESILGENSVQDGGAAKSRVLSLQFSPSTTHKTFFGGIGPVLREGQHGYEYQDGQFTEHCRVAEEDTSHIFVTVIDELSRANLSEVLGVVFTAMENVGESFPIPGTGLHFRFPKNMLIISTMNTDATVSRLDPAMMRRFALLRLSPTKPPLHALLQRWAAMYHAHVLPRALVVQKELKSINDALGEGGHGNYMIGPSSFLDVDIFENPARLRAEWTRVSYICERFLETRHMGQVCPCDMEDWQF